MIKVLHVIDTWGPGGAETVCLAVASGMDASRFRSRVIVTGRGWLLESLEARGIGAVLTPVRRPRDDVKLILSLARQIVTWRPDVLQCHLVNSALYGSVLGRMLGCPVVVTFHGHTDVPQSDPHAALKLRIIGHASKRMVFVSEALRRALCAGAMMPARKTAVVCNGVDTQRFRPGRSDTLRRLLGLDGRALIVGAVGNMRVPKGYDTMLRVIHALGGCEPEVHLAIAGWERPPVLPRLQALRAELGLEGRVHFLGFREDVPELLNGMDVYLSTSLTEGFSLTTVQAMAAGLPVVCTRSGGPEEIVTDGVDGVLVPVGDVPAIAAAVADLLARPAARAEMGAKGRRTVEERFTVEGMVKGYEAIYGELASG